MRRWHRIVKRWWRFRQWISAAAVATDELTFREFIVGRRRCPHDIKPGASIWEAVWRLAWLLCTRRASDTKPGHLWWRRMRACYTCTVYNRQHRTCGTPREMWPDGAGGYVFVGCMCYMPLKARLVKANECWLQEEGIGGGWKN